MINMNALEWTLVVIAVLLVLALIAWMIWFFAFEPSRGGQSGSQSSLPYGTRVLGKQIAPTLITRKAAPYTLGMPSASVPDSAKPFKTSAHEKLTKATLNPAPQQSPFWRLPDDYRVFNADGSSGKILPRPSDSNDNLQQSNSEIRRDLVPMI